MSAQHETGQPHNHPHRRSFLKASGAITAMAFIGTGMLGSIAYADALTKPQRDELSPDDILALMKKGNKPFYTGKREDHDFLAQQRASAKGQYPAAVLLTCSPVRCTTWRQGSWISSPDNSAPVTRRVRRVQFHRMLH
jgi:carbonic anhydrase